jgi:hypothetical protein
MAPRNKKTTMAKLAREHRLRERRIDKQARKDARKQAALDDTPQFAAVDDTPHVGEAAGAGTEPKEA